MPELSAAAARRHHIVTAAMSVFSRYGYTRTTMNDIAKAAGLTRPTLYQSFPDKEAVFRAVIDEMATQLFATIQEGLAKYQGLAEKLRFACESWGAAGFALVQANPDAKDMFDLCFEPVKNSYIEFANLIAGILRAPLSKASLNVDAEELARIVLFSIKGFKETARDVEDMRRLIAAHTSVIAYAIEPGGRQSRKAESTRTKMKRTSSKTRVPLP
jgi:AcrR family transcriptional regulator